jgi:hypothetical protein
MSASDPTRANFWSTGINEETAEKRSRLHMVNTPCRRKLFPKKAVSLWKKSRLPREKMKTAIGRNSAGERGIFVGKTVRFQKNENDRKKMLIQEDNFGNFIPRRPKRQNNKAQPKERK